MLLWYAIKRTSDSVRFFCRPMDSYLIKKREKIESLYKNGPFESFS